MATNKNYISESFQDRIQISLANISRSPEDKFEIVGIKYIPATFKCELCGHQPCLYAFSIKNIESNTIIDVGSECVKHFKGECDIDVTEGLKKRIKSVTRKMRRYMKKSLGDDYKEVDKEKKRELTVKLFMEHQTKEMLRNEQGKKVRLTKEEVARILEKNV